MLCPECLDGGRYVRHGTSVDGEIDGEPMLVVEPTLSRLLQVRRETGNRERQRIPSTYALPHAWPGPTRLSPRLLTRPGVVQDALDQTDSPGESQPRILVAVH